MSSTVVAFLDCQPGLKLHQTRFACSTDIEGLPLFSMHIILGRRLQEVLNGSVAHQSPTMRQASVGSILPAN